METITENKTGVKSADPCGWYESKGGYGWCNILDEDASCFGDAVDCICPEDRIKEERAAMEDWKAEHMAEERECPGVIRGGGK